MPKHYYFISDLHIGGDDALQECEFKPELIAFLQRLARRDEDIELIIAGDCFGLWEFTELDGMAKLDELIRHHQDLFEQFKAAGERIGITILPGNHDHELACYSQYSERLEQYNIAIESELSITRDLGGKKIWIEHGMQHDENNRMPEYGNPHANPLGFFVARNVVGKTGKHSSRGKFSWLKDMQSVHPMEEVPHWIWSNYFYREMNSILRLLLIPFLALFSVSAVVALGALLEEHGMLGTSRIFTDKHILEPLGLVGNVLDFILLVNGAVILVLVPIGIVLWLLLRDMKKTLERYELFATDQLVLEKHSVFNQAAKGVLEKFPEVMVFLYGHTHHAFIEEVNGKAIVNTGTWLKIHKKIPSFFMLFPDVYYPSYCLSFVSIHREGGRLVIKHETIEKKAAQELSWLQRLVILPRRKTSQPQVTEKMILEL